MHLLSPRNECRRGKSSENMYTRPHVRKKNTTHTTFVSAKRPRGEGINTHPFVKIHVQAKSFRVDISNC
jgi:hypothetical protein